MPPEVEVEQLADGDLPFMDGPHIIGVDMASGRDSTVVFQPPFAHALKGGAQ